MEEEGGKVSKVEEWRGKVEECVRCDACKAGADTTITPGVDVLLIHGDDVPKQDLVAVLDMAHRVGLKVQPLRPIIGGRKVSLRRVERCWPVMDERLKLTRSPWTVLLGRQAQVLWRGGVEEEGLLRGECGYWGVVGPGPGRWVFGIGEWGEQGDVWWKGAGRAKMLRGLRALKGLVDQAKESQARGKLGEENVLVEWRLRGVCWGCGDRDAEVVWVDGDGLGWCKGCAKQGMKRWEEVKAWRRVGGEEEGLEVNRIAECLVPGEARCAASKVVEQTVGGGRGRGKKVQVVVECERCEREGR